MADYPGAIPDLTTGVPSDGDAEVTPLGDDTYPHDDHHRDLGQEVEAIATELGTSPSGASVDVAARFAAVEAVADAAQTAGEVAAAVAAHEADTSVHGIADTTVLATDAEVAAAVAAEAALARNADNLTSGTVADARIASTIARDSEVTAAISAHEAASDPHTGYQKESEKAQAGGYASLDGSGLIPDGQIPSGIARDSEVTAAVSVAINTLLDGAPGALDTLNELAAAISDDADFAATVTAALAGKQPLDADLTAIAALGTTSFGRSLLELASSSAGRTALGVVIGTDVQAFSAVLAATTASFTTADETKLDGIEAGADVTDATNVAAAGAVMESDYDANTIIKADSDNTPEALTVAASRIVGRKASGDIEALTGAETGVIIAGGEWTSYTPAITAIDPFGSFGGAVNPTMGTGSSLTGAYTRIGRMVVGRAQIVFGTGAAAGTGYYGITLPVTPRNTNQSMGLGFLTDISDSARIVSAPFAIATVFSSTLGIILVEGQINVGASPASHAAPWTWADTDSISLNFMYEASADP